MHRAKNDAPPPGSVLHIESRVFVLKLVDGSIGSLSCYSRRSFIPAPNGWNQPKAVERRLNGFDLNCDFAFPQRRQILSLSKQADDHVV